GGVAFLSTKYGFGISSIKVMIAALVTFLPGGSMAMATAELSLGDMVSGSSRFISALIKVVLLTLGIVTAAMIVKLPPSATYVVDPAQQLGMWAQWVGVLIFAIGHRLHFSTTHGDFFWIVIALYIAYGVQIVADISFGGYMSVFLGAMVVTPFTFMFHSRMKGPPMLITFLPALWLLVPTSVALVGLTEFVSASQASGMKDFVTTVFSIISCAIGSLLGMWFYSLFFEPVFENYKEWSKIYQRKKDS
ncbi:MAG: threonine/serine exporter family protein, partial [Bdellovibrio sp.]|nr:threonine/serine exporter family protein [Bdellovibrio sp.]